MKIHFLTAVLALVLFPPASAPAGAIENVKVENRNFSVFTADPKTQNIGLYWKDPAGNIYGSFHDLESSLKKQGQRLDFATNAGIFEPGAIPTGLVMIGGKDILPLNLNPGRGNFFMKPNGVFLISRGKPHIMTTEDWLRFKHPIDLATQSGPMLVLDGKIHPEFTEGSTSKYIRSGVGINSNGLVSFAISREPVNFYDFAKFFRDSLGCKNALYLDGAISKFYEPGTPRLRESRENFAAIFAVTSPL